MYGGNVLGDIQAIKLMSQTNPARAAIWQETFTKMYELPYSVFEEPIRSGSRELHAILDTAVSVKTMKVWQRRRNAADRDLILKQAWRNWVERKDGAGDPFQEESTMAAYREVEELYRRKHYLGE